ncbi:MAG TPA: hypothetical protein DHW02_21015 [Ktedonobacter sp.]|nr:hypothetical protein [Ktedonobacter sp.]
MNDKVSPVQPRALHRSTGTITIVVVVLVLLGCLFVGFNVTRHNNPFGIGVGATGGKPCTSGQNTLAPVQYATGAGQSGLYAVRSEGLYRFKVQNGHLTPIWFFSMGWCPNIPTPAPSGMGGVLLPTPNIITSATVANGSVYFGVLENAGVYMYAIRASDGALLWRVKVGTQRGLEGPLVLHDLVYISTVDDKTGNPRIFALDAHTGIAHWSYEYPQSANNRNGVGLNNVVDNAIIVLDGDRFFALNATNGKVAWTTLTEGNQQTTDAQFFDGVLYVSSSSTCFNCEVQPATSAIYAYNPVTGTKLWSSQLVAGYPSPAYEVHGVVYYGTQAGTVYALQANDGTELWHSTVGGEVRTLPQVIGNTVYVGAGLFDTATNNPNTQPGYILALDIAQGKHEWSQALPSYQYTGYEPIVAGGNSIFLGTRPSFIDSFSSTQGTLVQYTVPSGQDAFNLNNMPSLTYVV